MSDLQKTIKILEDIPSDLSLKISMKQIAETLSIMFSINDNNNFEPTVEDFLEALFIRLNIETGINDIENSNFLTQEQMKEEIKKWK